jgi:RNA polymerase sigma-70 factor (ECF subfamily)
MDSDSPLAEVPEARARLFLRYQRMLRAFIRTLVANAQDAEDLLQEVGVIILKSGNQAMDPGEFRRWSRGVARNVMLHYWRSRRRSREVPSDRYVELIDAAYARIESETDLWNARGRALADCLGGLDESSRQLLHQRYVRNLPSEAIGREVGKSAVAVRKTLERVRDALLRCIEARVRAGLGDNAPQSAS